MQDAWYLISVRVLLGRECKQGLMLFPMQPLKKNRLPLRILSRRLAAPNPARD
jgi:hypothetical protein